MSSTPPPAELLTARGDIDQRPTRVRHWVVATLVLMSLLLYLDRFCVSFAERYIKEDLGLSETQMGWFLSAFFWSYALGQVPSGWLSDRYGARITLVLYVLSWSLFTAMIGLASGFWFLILMRLGCGLGQAGAYPTCGGVLSKWVPFSVRGMASSMITFGGRVGGAIAPLLTALLMVLFVPAEKNSSQLREQDLFHGQEASLALKLTDESSVASQRIWSRLPTNHQITLGLIAAEERSAIARRQTLLDAAAEMEQAGHTETAAKNRQDAEAIPGPEMTPAVRQKIVAALNAVITDRELFEASAFGSLNLAQEAMSLIVRQRKSNDLSTRESERLNRLLLEATFPAQIGKIYVSGWRPVVMVYGLAGFIVAGMFWIVFRNRPSDHPGCNLAEQTLIETGRPAGSPSPHGKAGSVPWKQLLKSVSLWLDSLTQVGTNIGWIFLVTYLARYLDEVHHVEIITRAFMAGLPLMLGFVGMLGGGWLTDWLVRAIGLRWGRALPIALTRFAAAAAYLGCLWTDDPWVATLLFGMVAFFCDLGVAAVWAFKQDVGGRHVGSILGWGNMWGNLAAALSPPLYNWVLTPTPGVQDWNAMFLVCAGGFFIAGVAGLGIDATIPIVPDEDGDKS